MFLLAVYLSSGIDNRLEWEVAQFVVGVVNVDLLILAFFSLLVAYSSFNFFSSLSSSCLAMDNRVFMLSWRNAEIL